MSGTRGLIEELGWYRGRKGKVECTLCGGEWEERGVCVVGVFNI